jgi:hypothetical protein
MQQGFGLRKGANSLDSSLQSEEEALPMGLTRPLNALFLCAAFGFIGALVMGFIA